MRSTSYVLPALFVMAGLSTAAAQTTSLPPPPETAVEQPSIVQAVPWEASPIADAAQGVRNASLVLRRACADLPHVTYVPDPAGRPVAAVRPFGVEEDTCAMASDPLHFMEGYIWAVGLIGGVVTLLALGVFTLAGGALRILWHGPLNRYRQQHWSST